MSEDPRTTTVHTRGWAVWPSLIISSAEIDETEMMLHNCGTTQPWSVLRWMETVGASPKIHMPKGWTATSGRSVDGVHFLTLASPERYVHTELWKGEARNGIDPSLHDVFERDEVTAAPLEEGGWLLDRVRHDDGQPVRITNEDLGVWLATHARTQRFSRSTRSQKFFVLGSRDVEMVAIAEVIRDAGRRFIWGRKYEEGGPHNGRLLAPGEDAAMPLPVGPIYMGVECAVNGKRAVFDHHGDRPEASAPPEKAWEASSLGRVWQYLHGYESLGPANHEPPPQRLRVIAALDHCLAAACAGKVPGVAAQDAQSEAKCNAYDTFGQPGTFSDFLIVMDEAKRTLLDAPPALQLCPAGHVADLTHLPIDGPVVEATGEQYPSQFQFGPVVGSVYGRGYAVRIRRRDGRIAVRIGGCGAGSIPGTEPIERWMQEVGELWECLPADAPRPDNLYGSPMRGFAGGTLADQEAAEIHELAMQVNSGVPVSLLER